MAKRDVIVKRELPSLFCATCREWVDTQEKHNMFASDDGKHLAVRAWQCKGCRPAA
jgi:hypothetical protein